MTLLVSWHNESVESVEVFQTMNGLQELRGLLRLRILQLLALSSFLAYMGTIAMASGTTVRDPDTWWHLKVGDWIVEHHAVPYVGIFSRTAGTHPWIAYSWGYEVLLSRCYAWFGLLGFAYFGIVLTIAVAFVLFWILQRLCGRFWLSWILSFAGSFAFLFSLMPRPVFFSMIFYAVLLMLLLEAQRSGRIQHLYWLPLLFVLWANIHIQFIYGLFVVGLFTTCSMVPRMAEAAGLKLDFVRPPSLPWPALSGIVAACFAATFLGPYSYHLYRVVAAYSNSHVPYFMIQELSALAFDHFTHYILLLLTASAFFAVGWRRKLDLFQLSLLIVASVIAFRTKRDAWFLAIAAAAFLADLSSEVSAKTARLKLPELAGVGAMVAILVILIAQNIGFTARALDRSISHEYPVDAANFLRRNPIPGPLYNHLDWGGFLIWYLPQYPVVVDGRNDLYGDDLDLRTYKSAQGETYTSDPYLNESGLVLMPAKCPLANLLTVDSRFRLVYQDALAVVYARQ
jgi:hypothetical protein